MRDSAGDTAMSGWEKKWNTIVRAHQLHVQHGPDSPDGRSMKAWIDTQSEIQTRTDRMLELKKDIERLGGFPPADTSMRIVSTQNPALASRLQEWGEHKSWLVEHATLNDRGQLHPSLLPKREKYSVAYEMIEGRAQSAGLLAQNTVERQLREKGVAGADVQELSKLILERRQKMITEDPSLARFGGIDVSMSELRVAQARRFLDRSLSSGNDQAIVAMAQKSAAHSEYLSRAYSQMDRASQQQLCRIMNSARGADPSRVAAIS